MKVNEFFALANVFLYFFILGSVPIT
jgi:hypothetical protein